MLVGSLPFLHRDPFDRLLVAQALGGGYRLVTSGQDLLRVTRRQSCWCSLYSAGSSSRPAGKREKRGEPLHCRFKISLVQHYPALTAHIALCGIHGGGVDQGFGERWSWRLRDAGDGGRLSIVLCNSILVRQGSAQETHETAHVRAGPCQNARRSPAGMPINGQSGPQDRHPNVESPFMSASAAPVRFFAEQSRIRAQTWRVTAAAVLLAICLGLLASAGLAPILLAVAAILIRLADLMTGGAFEPVRQGLSQFIATAFADLDTLLNNSKSFIEAVSPQSLAGLWRFGVLMLPVLH